MLERAYLISTGTLKCYLHAVEGLQYSEVDVLPWLRLLTSPWSANYRSGVPREDAARASS